jgi:hypothetical protein
VAAVFKKKKKKKLMTVMIIMMEISVWMGRRRDVEEKVDINGGE